MAQRLTRSSRNAVLGGVCAGIADFFGISPVIPRLIFFFFGAFPLYLLLWILLPTDNS
ncbi:MAG: PspC domain-containing protein [Paramuribaculum sp.]